LQKPEAQRVVQPQVVLLVPLLEVRLEPPWVLGLVVRLVMQRQDQTRRISRLSTTTLVQPAAPGARPQRSKRPMM